LYWQNDHGPEFPESTYNITVREDAPAGTIIALLKATDKDFGEFGKVTFLNYFDLFSVCLIL
jgi:hypothetical protein